MKVRTIHTAIVFLLSLIWSTHCVFALDDVLIDQPLTWYISSLQIDWTASQGDTSTKESMHICTVNPESDPSPLSLFGLSGDDVNAFVFAGGFDYNQTNSKANSTQWSESEKEVVNKALTAAFESNNQKTTSNQRLVFTVSFVNHTKSHLIFDHRYTNNIPVYLGQTEIGKASPAGIDKVIISIPPNGYSFSVKFEVQIDESCKAALLNNKPILKFSEGQLFFRIPVGEPEISGNVFRKSLVDKDHFTVAIQADREVIEWKINWIDKNPVTLQEALEAINDKVCTDNMTDEFIVFKIKDKHIVSVCDSPFTDKDAPDWLTELKVFKDGAFQTIADPDALLSETPRSGERYVFQLVNQEFKKLVAKANAGDATALNELGDRYYFGDGVPEDKVKAVELYRKSAEKDNAEGQYNLGLCYYFGDGIEVNKEETIKWYRKAAEQGYAEAQYSLGCCYFYGDGVKEDKAEAFKWIRKAGEAGHADAQCNLGFYYYNGEYVEKDKAEALKWWKKAAEQGNALAQYSLSCCYHNGDGVEVDTAEAIKWVRKAAESGYVDAQNNLGFCYLFGNCVEKDEEKAVSWFRIAAQQDDPIAYNSLGACYENGYGVEKDMKEAVSWYRKAAEKGNEVAFNNLGVCYENGAGVEKDMKEAVSWYQKAAEKDFPIAQFNLGNCYYNGEGVTQDKAEAVKWFRKAAEFGIIEAQFSLGNCYKSGKGVEKDVKEATKWFQKAADQGYEDAVKALKELNDSIK